MVRHWTFQNTCKLRETLFLFDMSIDLGSRGHYHSEGNVKYYGGEDTKLGIFDLR